MNRKYLDDINVIDRPDTWHKDDSKQEVWKKQREIYGFDEREVWSLDYTFNLWFYERLKMFKECASKMIDLDFHKFEFGGKEYTQRQMIDMMIERLEFSFKPEYDNLDEEQYKYVTDVIKIFHKVYGAMWW